MSSSPNARTLLTSCSGHLLIVSSSMPVILKMSFVSGPNLPRVESLPLGS